MKNSDHQDYQDMINDLMLEASDNLTNWELTFLESVSNKESLTQRQKDIIKKMHNDKVK